VSFCKKKEKFIFGRMRKVVTVAGCPGKNGYLDGKANEALFNEPRWYLLTYL
jgi:hypothetical protein